MAGKPWQPLEVKIATSPHGSEHGAFASRPCRYCQFSVSDGVPKTPRLHLGGNAIQPFELLSFQQLEGCRVGVVEDGQIVHP